MKKSLLTGFLTFAATCMLWAAPPRIEAVKLNGSIKLDGAVTEKAWDAVKWNGNFTNPIDGKKAYQPTKFKVLAGKEGLYFAIDAVDNDIFTATHEHDFALWNNDCIEIFITPVAEPSSDRNIREHKQFVFNVSNCRYEQASRGGIADTKWDLPWQAAVKPNSQGYTAEVYIPYYVMNPAANSKTWRFNVAREDVNKKSKRHDLSVWSPTKQFAEHDNFGYLCNIPADFSIYQAAYQGAVLLLKSAEGKAGSVVSGVLTGKPGKRYSVKAAVLASNKKIAAFNAVEKVLPQSGEMKLNIPLNLAESGNYILQTIVADDLGRIVSFDEKSVVFSAATLALDIIQPCYRNNIYLALPDPALELNIRSLAAVKDLKNAKLAVTVSKQGKIIAQKSIASPKAVEKVLFNAAKWQPGAYRVECVLADAGNSNGRMSADFNVIAPGKGNIITLDRERYVLVNGKRFFVRGFIGGPGDLKAQQKAGCNIVQFYMLHFEDIDKIIARLDQLQKLGMMGAFVPRFKMRSSFFGFLENGKEVKTLSPASYKKITQLVNAVKNHPAFFGWYLYDEPRGAEMAAELKRQYEFLRKIDPDHPVLGLDNSATGCVNKKGHCDIHILDMYPSPDKQNNFGHELATTASAVNVIVRGTGREGVWYCPQAFDRDCYAKGPNNHRSMTFVETRCTVWGAVAAGATGIFPFKVGTPEVKYFQRHPNSGIYASPEMHLGWLKVIMPELNNLAPVLTSDTIKIAAEPANPAVLRITARKYKDKNFVFAVNMNKTDLKVNITWPDKQIKSVKVLGEKRRVNLTGGKVTEIFKPYEVHIYTDDMCYPEGVNIPAVKAEIKAALKAAGR
ncbi:MAG: hypothetical protein E7039_05675 [Lentisphaerae bacterium]|nr:hypothetical protein [Lentisphaerota bacterium]